jgi:hypothetical protein
VVDLNAGYTRAKWVEKKGFHMARLRETAARFEGDADVSELFDAGRGKTVVVAGGGPTLPECFEWIQKFRSDVFVISATTALRPMVLAGFRPDLVIGIDPAEDLHFHLWDVPDDVKASVSFAYAPMVDPSFVAVWTGPRFAFLLDAPLYEEVFPGSGRSKLASGGSVVHAAMDLAVRMKPSAVVLAGLDFCFVGGFTHSKGVSMHTPIEELPDARFSVLTGEGKCERADINLMAYLQETETFLARNPGVRFYNVSRRGAVIRGAKYLFEESPWC